MEDPDHIGARIRNARQARQINRNQLARSLGTSWALVNQWESGRTIPTTKSIRRLAKILGVTVSYLVGSSSARLNEHLEEFLRLYLPSDLTDEELLWLESAPPTRSGPLSAEAYAAIVRALRMNRPG